MKQLPNTLLLLMVGFASSTLCMEVSEQAIHERALRGFKHPTTRAIAELTAAINYFEASPEDLPKREFWLRQCTAAKRIIDHLEPQVRMNFLNLVSEELQKIDKARWPKIKQVLPVDTSLNLDSDSEFINDLIALAHDPEANYTKWFRIFAAYKNRIYEQAKVQTQKASPLPPLPPELNFKKLDISLQLWTFLEEKNVVSLKRLLTKNKGAIELDAPHATRRQTPLLFSVSINNNNLCQTLLDHGANPNAPSRLSLPENRGDLQITPLVLAVNLGFVQRAWQLLNHKADPNVPAIYLASGHEEHALCCAAAPLTGKENYYSGKIQNEMIRLLLQNGATTLCSKIFFYNTVMGHGHQLDLKDPRLKPLMPGLLKATKNIDCRDGNIILINGSDEKAADNTNTVQQPDKKDTL